MATPEAVTALLAEARTDEEMLGRIQARFTAHCDASMTALAPAQFCDAMTELGAKREYCTQYFKVCAVAVFMCVCACVGVCVCVVFVPVAPPHSPAAARSMPCPVARSLTLAGAS